jgi:hypothetical protein
MTLKFSHKRVSFYYKFEAEIMFMQCCYRQYFSIRFTCKPYLVADDASQLPFDCLSGSLHKLQRHLIPKFIFENDYHAIACYCARFG